MLPHQERSIHTHLSCITVVRFGWTPNESLETHVKLVRDKLRNGAKILADIKNEYAARGQAEPADEEVANYEPPHEDDPYVYLQQL